MGVLFIFLLAGSFLLYQGTSGVDTEGVSVKEGDSVTLHTGVQKTQQSSMKWYFNTTRIAQINGIKSKSCTDVQCNEGTEKFRGRLKLDHQTGSLTIMNITNLDDGEYKLKISSYIEKIFSVSVHDVSAAERDEMKRKVKEGESVTLDTGVVKIHHIIWAFHDTLIAEITGNQSKICTDVQCNEVNERFRDRLKLDHQTGSLTIMNTRNTDSGEYQLKIYSSSDSEMIFSVTVHGVSAAERDEVKRKSVKEGESVNLDPGVINNPNDVMTWYFNDILISEITGDQSKICTDVQCDERFRDRLKLDHQTGSLTILNTSNTDFGLYKLQIIINNSSFSITTVKRFSVTVTAVPDSGLSSGVVAGIAVAVLLVFAAAAAVAVVYCRRRIHTAVQQDEDDSSPDPNDIPLKEDASLNQPQVETASKTI